MFKTLLALTVSLRLMQEKSFQEKCKSFINSSTHALVLVEFTGIKKRKQFIVAFSVPGIKLRERFLPGGLK